MPRSPARFWSSRLARCLRGGGRASAFFRLTRWRTPAFPRRALTWNRFTICHERPKDREGRSAGSGAYMKYVSIPSTARLCITGAQYDRAQVLTQSIFQRTARRVQMYSMSFGLTFLRYCTAAVHVRLKLDEFIG